MDDLARLLQGQLGGAMPTGDIPLNDTSEKIQISSLALLKMLKHGKEITKRSNRKGWCTNGSHGSDVRRIY